MLDLLHDADLQAAETSRTGTMDWMLYSQQRLSKSEVTRNSILVCTLFDPQVQHPTAAQLHTAHCGVSAASARSTRLAYCSMRGLQVWRGERVAGRGCGDPQGACSAYLLQRCKCAYNSAVIEQLAVL